MPFGNLCDYGGDCTRRRDRRDGTLAESMLALKGRKSTGRLTASAIDAGDIQLIDHVELVVRGSS